MNTIIVEDEKLAAQRLSRLITEINPTIKIVACFETIKDTHIFLQSNEIDLIFLDIQLADGNSFELFNLIDVKAKVIFTTAYSEYAVEAFRKNALDYLMKPIKKEELEEAIAKVSNQNINYDVIKEQTSLKDKLLIKFGSKTTVLKLEELAYVFSENKIAYFYLKSGTKIASDFRLQELEDMLDKKSFFRINRQFIVNVDSVVSMSIHTKARVKVKLNPEFKDDIIVSTEKTPELKKWLKQ
jgi:DNA-binding LytR/AlgR family response regulator